MASEKKLPRDALHTAKCTVPHCPAQNPSPPMDNDNQCQETETWMARGHSHPLPIALVPGAAERVGAVTKKWVVMVAMSSTALMLGLKKQTQIVPTAHVGYISPIGANAMSTPWLSQT